jgi:hypothetical protein
MDRTPEDVPILVERTRAAMQAHLTAVEA